jgi:hypothetical protein
MATYALLSLLLMLLVWCSMLHCRLAHPVARLLRFTAAAAAAGTAAATFYILFHV